MDTLRTRGTGACGRVLNGAVALQASVGLVLALAVLGLVLTILVPAPRPAGAQEDEPFGALATSTQDTAEQAPVSEVPVQIEASEPAAEPAEAGAPTVLGAQPSAGALPPLELVRPLTVPELVQDAARRWGMTPAQARQFDCIARHESGYDARAVGTWTRYGTAKGVMQFIDPTWASASRAVGLADASVFNPAANIEAAAYWYLYGQGPSAWETVVPKHLC